MSYQQYALIGALLIILLSILRAIHRRDKDTGSAINLEDLLLGDDGRLSKAAIVMLGSFALTSWVIVYLTLSDKLTEGYFAAYGGFWIAPVVVRLFKSGQADAPA